MALSSDIAGYSKPLIPKFRLSGQGRFGFGVLGFRGFDCLARVIAAQACRQHAGSWGSEFHVSFLAGPWWLLQLKKPAGVELLGSARVKVQCLRIGSHHLAGIVF